MVVNLLACWDKEKEAVRGGGLLNTHSAVCEHSAAEIDAKDRPELFSLLSLFKWLHWEDSKSCLWATQNAFQVTERFRAPTANRRTHFTASHAKNTSCSKSLPAFSVWEHNSIYLLIGNVSAIYLNTSKEKLPYQLPVSYSKFCSLKERFSIACCFTSHLFEDRLLNILHGFLCNVLSDQRWQKVHKSVQTQNVKALKHLQSSQ